MVFLAWLNDVLIKDQILDVSAELALSTLRGAPASPVGLATGSLGSRGLAFGQCHPRN